MSEYDALNIVLKTMPNPEFRKFSVLKRLPSAQGGMSCGVYEARKEGSDKRWVLKIIDEELLDLNERKMHQEGSRWKNAHIVRAVYTTELYGRQYILMDYHEVLRNFHSDMDPETTAILIGTHICEALSSFHYDDTDLGKDRLGVLVHGDVKPDNIFWDNRNGNILFLLGDFGTVRQAGKALCAYTRDYAAPEAENTAQEIGPAADIFSLGLVMLWYVCGKDDAFISRFRAGMANGELPERPGQCSVYFWKVILHATEKDPKKRTQSAESLLSELRDVTSRKLEDSNKEKDNLKTANVIEGVLLAAAAINHVLGLVKKRNEKQKQNRIAQENREERGRAEQGNREERGRAEHGKQEEQSRTGQRKHEEDAGEAVIRYPEFHSYYVGEAKGGRPCGKGRYIYSDGSSASGVWQPCETNTGTWDLGDEELILGGWLCDGKSLCGIISMEVKDKWEYIGEIKSGDICGTGRFSFVYENEWRIIEGSWKEVKKEKISADRTYTGMVCNDRRNGRGILQIADVGTFNGIFLNEIPCRGTLQCISGRICDGDWKVIGDNVYQHGVGSVRSEDGRVYVGTLKKGRYEGYGEMQYPDGACYKGMWKEGKRDGTGRFRDNNGKTYAGKWKNGKLIEKE